MARIRRDVNALKDFDDKSKGSRCAFIDSSETFSVLLRGVVNSKLRNGMTHKTYKYDGMKQLITYYPSGDGQSAGEEIYLLDFARCSLALFLAVWDVSELVYQTQARYYMAAGL
jgi:hypothetical protein